MREALVLVRGILTLFTMTWPLQAAEVKSSTAAASAPDVSSVYTAEKLRDPFLKGGASGGAPVSAPSKEFTAEDFNIHNLFLKGIMKDADADYALLVDRGFGTSFILRKGRLYDLKNKPVPGVSGTIDIKAKRVNVMTADKDVQVLRLGEKEEPE